MNFVNLADAKIHLSELVAQAQAGEAVCITRRGKPAAKLSAAEPPRRPISLSDLRSLTNDMPFQDEAAGDFIRQMRDKNRY